MKVPFSSPCWSERGQAEGDSSFKQRLRRRADDGETSHCSWIVLSPLRLPLHPSPPGLPLSALLPQVRRYCTVRCTCTLYITVMYFVCTLYTVCITENQVNGKFTSHKPLCQENISNPEKIFQILSNKNVYSAMFYSLGEIFSSGSRMACDYLVTTI